jgi:copper transport protein
VAVAIAVVAALAAVPSALAHASLVSSTPAADEVLLRAPNQVVVQFSEPVESAFGSVRVYDGSSQRVDDGHTTRRFPDEVAVGLRPGLARGTYTVAWRVVSSDSHPVQGAFVFHVGKPGAGAAGVAATVLDDRGGSAAVDHAFTVVRFLTLALILLCGGAAIALAVVFTEEERSLRRPVWLAVAVAGAVLALVTAVGVGLEGARASGLGLGSAARPALIGDVLDTRFGQVWLVRVGLALAVAGVAWLALRRPSLEHDLATGLCSLAVLIGLTPALSGHARVDGFVAVISDWAHVLAAAAWAGGLVFLVLALVRAREERWPLAARTVPRFSTVAVGAIAVLLIAGAASAFLEIRSWHGLWDTTYGRLLLVKIALVLPLLGLGAFNNRFSVPRLRAGLSSALDRRRFLAATATELALVVAVVGVTAVLVAEPPARAETADTGSVSGPVSRTAEIGPFELDLLVDPALTGPNQLHLSLFDRSTGQPGNVAEWRVAATLPAAGVGPLPLKTTPAGPGHVAVLAAPLSFAGTWRIRVDVRRGEFDQWSAILNVPIQKETTHAGTTDHHGG